MGSILTRHATLHVLKAGIEECQILSLLLSHDAQVQNETLIELSTAAQQTIRRRFFWRSAISCSDDFL